MTWEASLRALARDGQVSCRQALSLAERSGLDPREVGRACDRFGLKIVSCRLGCFNGSEREVTRRESEEVTETERE
jgi:hypothetical protein